MAFYLRKYLKTGPFRLNLSKGGLGLSGGIVGARIGIGPKGAYVHGGRHGIYYRKYASKGRGKVGRNYAVADDTDTQRPGEEVRYFMDTGMTFRPPVDMTSRPTPQAPDLPGHSLPANILLGAGLLLALTWFAIQEPFYLIAGIVLLTGGILMNSRHQKQREKAEDVRQAIEEGLRKKESVQILLDKHHVSDVAHRYRPWMDFHVFALFQDAFYEDPEYILPDEIQALEDQLSLSYDLIQRMKADVFSEFLDEVMEDHVITREEEKQLDVLQAGLRIRDEDITTEKHLIHQMCAFRDAVEGPLRPVNVKIPLRNNEACYYHCQGRVLKEKIFGRYQRQLVQYKEIGYDIDVEGDIYLCTNRLLIVDRGSRDYPLNRLLDMCLSLEDHTVQLTLDGRKNPLILTMPDVATFAGKLRQVVERE